MSDVSLHPANMLFRHRATAQMMRTDASVLPDIYETTPACATALIPRNPLEADECLMLQPRRQTMDVRRVTVYTLLLT